MSDASFACTVVTKTISVVIRTDSGVVHQCDVLFFLEGWTFAKIRAEGRWNERKKRLGRGYQRLGWGKDFKKAGSNIERTCLP